LARKANVDLTQYRSGRSAENGKIKEQAFRVLELATKFYQVQFSRHQVALKYVFEKRAFTKDTALAFRLGYAPNNGGALIDFLKKQGFTEQVMRQAGLTAKHYRGGIQDMFRGRLMIPLMDPQGRVIGFTARMLQDDPNAPKYINTPQTILYDKSRHVYGLHLAKESIRREGFAVMVEGNLDVIASYQAGIAHVVATAGTALTEMHLKGLSRFTGDIRLAFDQDKAGQAATERAIPIASKVGVSLSMITIPEGKDPDELVRKDPELWRKAIGQNQYALDWLVERYRAQLDLTSALGKRQFTDVLLKVVRELQDEVEQDHYVGRIAEIIGANKEALENKLNGIDQVETPPLRKGKVEPAANPRQYDTIKIQNHYLCLVMMRPGLRQHLEDMTADMLPSSEAGALLTFLQAHPDFDGSKEAQAKLTEVSTDPAMMQKLQDYVRMLLLQYETLYQEVEDVELIYEVARLRTRLIEQYVKTKKAALANQMRGGGNPDMADLLEQAKTLDQLLVKLTKEAANG
jgi:DNA primase